MKNFILWLMAALAISHIPARAQPARYVVQCTNPSGCVMPLGTAPNGSALNRIMAPAGFNPGSGLTLVADTGQILWTPPSVNPTVISYGDFFNRFTAAEQLALQTAAATAPNIQLGLTRAAAAGTVDLTDAKTTAWMTAVVSAGAVSAGRATTILTP